MPVAPSTKVGYVVSSVLLFADAVMLVVVVAVIVEALVKIVPVSFGSVRVRSAVGSTRVRIVS